MKRLILLLSLFLIITCQVCAQGTLYGFTSSANIPTNLVSIDVQTDQLNVINPMPSPFLGFTQGMRTFDPVNNHIYLTTNDRIIQIDASDASIINTFYIRLYDIEFAYNSEKLFGFTDGVGGPVYLVSIDPNANLIDTVGTIPFNYIGTSGISTFDSENEHIYLMSHGKIVQIDANTASILNTFDLQLYTIEYSVKSDKLFGILSNPPGPRLVSIQPTTGQIDTIGTFIVNGGFFQGMSTFDNDNEHIYFVSSNKLVQLDVANASIIKTINTSVFNTSIFEIEFDNQLDSTTTIVDTTIISPDTTIAYSKTLDPYPNPAENQFRILLPEKDQLYTVEVFNLSGYKIFSKQYVNGVHEIEIPVKGTFIIQATSENDRLIGRVSIH